MSQAAVGAKKSDPLRQQLDELDHLMQRMLALGVNQSPADLAPDPEPDAVEFVEVGAEAPSHADFDTAAQQVEQAIDIPAPAYSDPEPANTPQLEPVASQRVEPPAPADTDLESEIDLAFRAPAFVSIEAIASTSPAPLYADFQFASTSNEPVMKVPAPTADFQSAAPPSEPARSEPAPIPDFQFAPPPSELVTQELAAIPEATLTSPAAEPVIYVVWWLRPLALVNGIYDGSTRWLGPIGRGLRSQPMRNLLGICGLAALVGAAAWVLWEGADWNS
jgi:hypothetical protein